MRSRGPFPPIHKIAIFPGSSLLQQRSEARGKRRLPPLLTAHHLFRLLSEPRVCFASILTSSFTTHVQVQPGFFSDLGLSRPLRYDLDWIVENGIVVVVAVIKALKPDPKHVHSEVSSTESSVPGHLKAA